MVNSRLLVFAIQEINYWITWQAWVSFHHWVSVYQTSIFALWKLKENVWPPFVSLFRFGNKATSKSSSPLPCARTTPNATSTLQSCFASPQMTLSAHFQGQPIPFLQTQADRKQGTRKRRKGEHSERIETWTVQSRSEEHTSELQSR